MYCPEHKVFGSRMVWVWMYWRDVPRHTIPRRVWLNPLFQKGRLRTPRVAKFGSTNPAAKLDEATVRSIRRLLNQHWTQREIAERHGISQSQVSNIARGRQWRRAK